MKIVAREDTGAFGVDLTNDYLVWFYIIEYYTIFCI